MPHFSFFICIRHENIFSPFVLICVGLLNKLSIFNIRELNKLFDVRQDVQNHKGHENICKSPLNRNRGNQDRNG